VPTSLLYDIQPRPAGEFGVDVATD